MRHPVSHLRAIGFALLGYTLWVLADSCIKFVSIVPPYEVIAILGIGGMLAVVVQAAARTDLKGLLPKDIRAQLGRGGLALCVIYCSVIGLGHLPLAVFYVMIFMSPLIVAIMAALFLKEKLDLKKALAVLAGFAGIIIAIHPGTADARGDWVGYTAMSLGALFFSLNAIWVRRMSQTETVMSMIFVMSCCDIIGGGVPMLWHFAPIDIGTFLILLAAGAISVAGSMAYALALKHTTASNVAQFHYTQIITGALSGYLVWNETLTLPLIIGAMLIIASGIYIAAHARKAENLAASQPL